MLLHINPTRQRGKRTGSLAGASGWYMTFFAAGVIADAVADARQSITHADHSGDASTRMANRTTAADAEHHSGRRAEAGTLFTEERN
jgi:hypothetical protein